MLLFEFFWLTGGMKTLLLYIFLTEQGLLVQRLCEGVLHRASDPATAKEGFDKVAGPVWTRLRGLLHAVGGLSG